MKKLLSILTLVALAPLSLSANWQLVRDFNDGSLDGISTKDTNHSEQHFTLGIIDVVPRPFDEAGGMSLATSAGFGLYNDYQIWISIPPIADMTDGTVYIEFAQSDQSNNTAWGTTNVEVPGDNDARWGNFYALVRSNFGQFDVYDFSGYQNVGSLEAQSWYKMWFHVDNAADQLTVFVQGGEWEEQTEIYTEAIFRNEISVADMVNFMIIQAAGNLTNPTSGQYVYWDNLHVDTTGLNLSNPEVDDQPIVEINPFDDLNVLAWTNLGAYGDYYGYQSGSGWAYNHSIGFVHTDEYPWLYSPEIGFFSFVEGDYKSEEGIYIFAPEHGWLNVGVGYWSSLWLFDDGSWTDLNN